VSDQSAGGAVRKCEQLWEAEAGTGGHEDDAFAAQGLNDGGQAAFLRRRHLESAVTFGAWPRVFQGRAIFCAGLCACRLLENTELTVFAKPKHPASALVCSKVVYHAALLFPIITYIEQLLSTIFHALY
jgi:hypothetical protein